MSVLDKAVELFMAGRLGEARRACRNAVQARPDLAEGHMLMAEIHRGFGDEARARESTRRVLRLRPGWSEAHACSAMADLFADAGRRDEAVTRYRRALELDPGFSDARYNLASALLAAGRVAECIAELQWLVERDPEVSDAREQLVQLLQEARRFDEVDVLCRAGMAAHPANSYYPQKLGVALWWRGRYEEALQAYRRAADLARDPGSDAHRDAKILEANGLLTLGRYAAGWDAYRWRYPRARLRTKHPEIIDDPRRVAALSEAKSLRILSEQGLGDELFFLRFALPLRARGHRLSVVCEEKLARILADMPGLFESVNPSSGEPDVVLCSGDLPLTGEYFAPPLALPLDAQRRERFEARLRAFGPPPYVGVTWRGGLLPDERDPQQRIFWTKDVAPELLAQALRPLDARIVILQRRPAAAELSRFCDALGREALDLREANEDLRDALGVLALIDEYVGVSNTNMHLRAGIPGRSARVLVQTPSEWRWGLSGSESPWFPGFRLYRQALGRDWTGALSALHADLSSRDAAPQHQ